MGKQRYCMPDPTAALTDELIRDQIDVGSRVIDLGCGDGRLLDQLRNEHRCTVQGVELDQEQLLRAIARGVPVSYFEFPDEGHGFRAADVISRCLNEEYGFYTDLM